MPTSVNRACTSMVTSKRSNTQNVGSRKSRLEAAGTTLKEPTKVIGGMRAAGNLRITTIASGMHKVGKAIQYGSRRRPNCFEARKTTIEQTNSNSANIR